MDPSTGVSDDDRAWEARSALWAARAQKKGASRGKRQRPSQPLILAGHGVSLRIEGGALTVRDGFTHYPQKQKLYRFFKGEPAIPERIILLDGTGSISFDVLNWLAEQGISLIRIDWRGEIISIASQSGYAANPYRVQWQRDTRGDPIKRMEFAVGKITQKIENSIVTMEKAIRRNDAWNRAVEIAYKSLTTLDEGELSSIGALRALEANAAAAYFRAWKGMPIKWRGTSRRPIPDAWKEIGQRTSVFHLAGSRNASHPVNALLNYAYTVLQSQLQIQAVSEGYDPTIGIMHEATDGSAAFIFDLMEPFRPQVDRRVIAFIKGQVFDPADFTIRADGVCRLNPEMSKMLAHVVSG